MPDASLLALPVPNGTRARARRKDVIVIRPAGTWPEGEVITIVSSNVLSGIQTSMVQDLEGFALSSTTAVSSRWQPAQAEWPASPVSSTHARLETPMASALAVALPTVIVILSEVTGATRS